MWSISVQFFGSLFGFALISVFGHDRRRNLVFAVIIAWAIFAGSPRFGVHLAAFTIGAWFFTARSRPATAEGTSATGSRTNRVVVVGVATTVAVYFVSWPDEQDVGPWYSFLASRARFMDSYLRPRAMAHTIAAVAVFWLVLNVPEVGRVLRRRGPRRLGRLSFSIYLVHWPILMSAGAWGFATVASRHESLYLGAAVGSGTTLALTLGVAESFARQVDQPSAGLAQRLADAWSTPRSPSRLPAQRSRSVT